MNPALAFDGSGAMGSKRSAGMAGGAQGGAGGQHGMDDGVRVAAALHAISDSDVDFLRVVFQFLQGLCEGHYAPIQNFLRSQSSDANGEHGHTAPSTGLRATNHNLVVMACDVLDALYLRLYPNTVNLVLQVLDTITEMVQGPCLANQVAIVNVKVKRGDCRRGGSLAGTWGLTLSPLCA